MSTIYRACTSVRSLAALLALAAGCDSAALSLSEIQMHPSDFIGQRVRVRGWSSFGLIVAGVGCPPQNPCCNSGEGLLTLNADPVSTVNPYTQSIGVADYSCTKSGCSELCGPFDPTALAFEMVGVLKKPPVNLVFYSLALYDIDWQESSQLTGGGDLFSLQKVPLSMGTFTIPSP